MYAFGPTRFGDSFSLIVTCLSDTHELYRDIYLPPGDLLIHAGDVTFFSRRPSVLKDFNEWLVEQPYRYKVLVPGNHDTLLALPEFQKQINNAHLLINSGVELGGVKIWGSPVTNLSSGAFAMPDEADRAKVWATIPSDTDILVTHIPPSGILDGEPGSDRHSGCMALRKELKRLQLKLHVFGHVHSAAGIRHTASMLFVNASLAGPLGDLDKEPVRLRLDNETKPG